MARRGRERQGDGASGEDQETKKRRDGEKLAAGNGIKSATARPLPGSSRKKLCTCQLLMLRRGILSCAAPAASSCLSLWHFLLPSALTPVRSFRAYFSATGEFSLERFLLQTLPVARERLDLYNERCGASSRRISMHPVFARCLRPSRIFSDISSKYFLRSAFDGYGTERG